MFAPLALVLAAAQPLTARECAGATAQMEMTACAEQEFERADAELNRVWRPLVSSAARNDRSPDSGRTPRDQRSEEVILRTAQRAWIAYRDAECEYEGLGERGGSMEPMIVAQCLARLTRARTTELRAGGE